MQQFCDDAHAGYMLSKSIYVATLKCIVDDEIVDDIVVARHSLYTGDPVETPRGLYHGGHLKIIDNCKPLAGELQVGDLVDTDDRDVDFRFEGDILNANSWPFLIASQSPLRPVQGGVDSDSGEHLDPLHPASSPAMEPLSTTVMSPIPATHSESDSDTVSVSLTLSDSVPVAVQAVDSTES